MILEARAILDSDKIQRLTKRIRDVFEADFCEKMAEKNKVNKILI